jgi:hypothetical protein
MHKTVSYYKTELNILSRNKAYGISVITHTHTHISNHMHIFIHFAHLFENQQLLAIFS